MEEITPYLKVTKVTPGSWDLHRRLQWEVKLFKGTGQNPKHGRKPKVKPRSNDRWQRPVNAWEITRWNSFLTFHSHKNNRTLKLNNDILKGNTSTDDTSCIVQPPGHTPKPELRIVQVCGGEEGGGGNGERAERAGERRREAISKQREDTVTVHFFSFPKDLSLHFIDFFKWHLKGAAIIHSFGFCLAFKCNISTESSSWWGVEMFSWKVTKPDRSLLLRRPCWRREALKLATRANFITQAQRHKASRLFHPS